MSAEHQRFESGLPEVRIRCQGIADIGFAHDLETDAVGQTPLFVGTIPEQLKCAFQQCVGQGHDLDIRIDPHCLYQAHGRRPKTQPRKRRANFKNDGLGGHKPYRLPIYLLEQASGDCVKLVAWRRHRNHEPGVNKPRPRHAFVRRASSNEVE